MSNEVATRQESKELVVTDEILRNFLFAQGTSLNEREQASFFQIAKSFGLNPFKREIYCIAFGDGDKRKLSIVTGYEVYIKRAERTGLLDGWKTEFFGRFEKKRLKKEIRKRDGTSFFKDVDTIVEVERCFARITIYRKDQRVPFEHEVELCEYYQDNELWPAKPVTMLKKVAIGQGFRLCFSDELAGAPYLSEELPSAKEIDHEELSVQPPANATAAEAEAAMRESQRMEADADAKRKEKREANESDRPAFDDYIRTVVIAIGIESILEVCVSHGYDDHSQVLPKDFRSIVNALKELMPK